MKILLPALTLVFLSVAGKAGAQTRQQPGITRKVDQLFARWNHSDTPGGAVGIIQNGKIVYSRGYGRANLEYGIPNTPKTLFHLASVSKQFTAFAIHLLVQDGKLSLNDDVRKYIPELPDFGKTITINHLIYHTSGLRDQPHLMWLGGWRFEDAVTEQDVLHLISQQKELNFTPGQEDLYCNTSYTLLGVIVKRVSGKSFSEFAQERIFKPLGMNHTLLPKDYSDVIRNRAYSYQPGSQGGYQDFTFADSTLGPTGVVTSVEDMALWDKNFDEGTVGGKEVQAAMLKKGMLNSGKETSRGSGILIEEYRGLKVIKHSGSIAGYRSRYIRFPDEHLSVVILANTSDVDADSLAWKAADLYLAEKLQPEPALVTSEPKNLPVEPRLLNTTAPLTDFVGTFYSDELNVLYTVSLRNGKLFLRHPRGEMEMVQTFPDTFALPYPFNNLRYTRGTGGGYTGFLIDNGRVRNLRVRKVEIKFVEK
ncbi:MAG: serine hydrolase domain-containing protein [Armatimonas sp.]